MGSKTKASSATDRPAGNQWSAEMLARFAPKEGSWKCSTCTTLNPPSQTMTCIACEAVKPGMEEAFEAAQQQQHENIQALANVGSRSINKRKRKEKKQAAAPTFTFGIPAPVTTENDHAVDITTKDRVGTVYTFGTGEFGGLGHGEDLTECPEPTVVAALEKKRICQVKCGGMHTLVLTTDNDLFSWGCNDDQVLGRDGDEYLPLPVQLDYCGPTQGQETTKVIELAAGDCHSSVLYDDGTVYSWGTYRDESGYVGFNNDGVEKQSTPTLLRFHPALSRTKKSVRITSIASGPHHDLAVSDEGTVYSWGTGSQGQLARRVNPRRKKAQLVPQIIRLGRHLKHKVIAQSVFCGNYHSFATTRCHGVYGWGLNNYGQLGLEDREDRMNPSRVELLDDKDICTLDGGEHHSAAISVTGELYTFGRCDTGQLGLGGFLSSSYVDEPTRVLNLPSIVQISCGSAHTLALTKTGRVYAFGYADMGQLGTGKDDCELEMAPVLLDKFHDTVLISAGAQFSSCVQGLKPAIE